MPKSRGTRRRSLPGPVLVQKTEKFSNLTVPDGTTITRFAMDGIQITESEGHLWPAPKGKLEDRGGPFFTKKSFVASPRKMPVTKLGPTYVSGPGNNRQIYTGPLVAYPTASMSNAVPTPWPPDLSSSDDDLDEVGATAIARCEPTNSVADVSTALMELMKEGLPSLVGAQSWRNRADSARKRAGGEYLNVQFGWLPLVGELGKISKAISESDRILTQYERDAGRVVRRRYYFPSQRSVSETRISPGGIVYVSPNNGQHPLLRPPFRPTGKMYRTRETVRRQWFAGAFTYYLPSGYDSRNRLSELARRAEVLLGTDLTPETLWNIGPWSWAVDWFANTGDVVHNLTAFKTNGLILRYGYVMEHTVTTDTYTFVYDDMSSTWPKVAPLILVTETKKRRPANPFGFGVQWSGLSPFQLSIAAALGLSRGR